MIAAVPAVMASVIPAIPAPIPSVVTSVVAVPIEPVAVAVMVAAVVPATPVVVVATKLRRVAGRVLAVVLPSFGFRCRETDEEGGENPRDHQSIANVHFVEPPRGLAPSPSRFVDPVHLRDARHGAGLRRVKSDVALRLTSAVYPASVPSAPVLVLLHGLGSNEQDLLSLAPELEGGLTVVALRAPFSYGGGFSWFGIEWTATGLVPDEVQAVESRELLLEELPQIAARFGASRLLLGGFSQGAMMTLGVAAAAPSLLAGGLLLSGAPLPAFLTPVDLSSAPFLVQHGLYDEVLPVDLGRRCRDHLASQGASVTYHEYPMGHEVSYRSLADMKRWLDAIQ